jgi:hypothetical protein
MSGPNTGVLAVASALLIVLSLPAADSFDVKIIDRQNHEATYNYVVPAATTSHSNTNLNCSGNDSNINCSGATNTTATTTPGSSVSYPVSGATLSLKLPDGRIAIVNCDSKSVGLVAILGVPDRRSCHIPLTNDIRAEFSGDRAKLKWPVSLDGKKQETESYKILGVIGTSNK